MPVDATAKNQAPEPFRPQRVPVEDSPLDHLLVQVDDPWYRSLLKQIQERLHPEQLPPLELTSQPVAVKSIWGDYRYGKVSGVSSVIVHSVIIFLLLFGFRHQIVQAVKTTPLYINLADLSPYETQLPPSKKKAGGGGGGGDRSPEPASKGKLPKLAMIQKAPPTVIIRNPEPKLPVEPTVIVPPQIQLASPNLAQLGDPMAKIAPPSNGVGFGGGIGSGSGGGVGSGDGGGVGPGSGGGVGGGVFRVGGGVSAPAIVFKVEPEYSEQARKAKYQGTVVLNIIVQRDGTVRDVKIVQPLGLGLDEKAIEAVKQWRFKPGQKNGSAVDVQATIEVTFRLL